jgi:hypothetical protein
MLTVRVASQAERGQVEIDLLRDSVDGKELSESKISIRSIFLDYEVDPAENANGVKKDRPPLSWKLSPKQYLGYQEAWNRLVGDPVMQEIDEEYFTPHSKAHP